ncbi:DUF3157 family protein [Photobacterium lipolyticum]|uniref:DUF3157 domain-containing protein n=1 Tax=Photobacterium lipolyticum TaxID=266810 RepID=A0A2T3MWI3_9GAMM|nr:DUF3157 family protein [Photobacterium lipolyticum]PSW04330.1 DUF3157 domain-containing protein [Photobacterium lipolyticum]
MKTMTRLCGVLVALATTGNAWGADQIVNLQDGRQVVLHDDFTWQYVAPVIESPKAVGKTQADVKVGTDSAKPAVMAIPVATASPAGIPVATAQKAVRVELGVSKNIQQLSKSGIDVLLQSARYENGELVIPTMLTNQGTGSVVSVVLKVKLMSENGRELASEDLPIWSSIKRVPETYFRPKTQQEGKPVKLPVPEASAYFISAEIIEVEHW